MTDHDLLSVFQIKSHDFRLFCNAVEDYFKDNPDLVSSGRNLVHSTKSRIKENSHILEKILRKKAEGRELNKDNVLDQITDFAGVRVLLLYQHDFEIVHKAIIGKVENQKDWVFWEDPVVYTWDPEHKEYFQSLNVRCETKSSAYTSVHYVVKPHDASPLKCEIQVRTLFEEIWGEVDHHLNYPKNSEDTAIIEQIRVLSKIVGAGSRLLDSIHRANQSS